MIRAMSDKITRYMNELGVLEESIEIHRYGVETILSTVISLTFIFALSLISGRLIEGLIYSLGFYYMRKFSGGYHCDTHLHCIGLYVIIFIVYLLTCSVYEKMNNYIALFSVLVFIIYVPVHNRKLNQKEHELYKAISMMNLFIYIVLSSIGSYRSIFSYLLLVISILIIAGIRKYEV